MNTESNSNIGQFEVGGEDAIFQPVDEFVGTGSMDNVAFPTAARPNNYSIQSQTQYQGDSRSGWLPQWLACLNFGSFQSYFDVDTEDVKDRVIGSVIHANSADHFVNEILRKPGKSADLYGPVWITMTCVFLFAVSENDSRCVYCILYYLFYCLLNYSLFFDFHHHDSNPCTLCLFAFHTHFSRLPPILPNTYTQNLSLILSMISHTSHTHSTSSHSTHLSFHYYCSSYSKQLVYHYHLWN